MKLFLIWLGDFLIKRIGNWKNIEMQIDKRKLQQIPLTESQNLRQEELEPIEKGVCVTGN